MKRYFSDESVVLFQGDSVTDCGRSRTDLSDLGPGYSSVIKALYDSLFPDNRVHFINRGVSGDRVRNLLERYDEDFLKLKPDFISILIGVNDTWRAFDSNDPCPIERYREEFELLISKIRADMPDTQIMIISPFILHTDEAKICFHSDLNGKIYAERDIANKYGCIYLPMQDILAATVEKGYFTDAQLSADGVHPLRTGHSVIAAEFLKKLNII